MWSTDESISKRGKQAEATVRPGWSETAQRHKTLFSCCAL